MKIEIRNFTLKPNADTFIDVEIVDGEMVNVNDISTIDELVNQLLLLKVKSVDIVRK